MISREQYNEWRNHPATLFFRKFLKDKSNDLIRHYAESWLAGADSFEKENVEARGYIRGLMECSDVEFAVIETFYEEMNAAKDTEADASGVRPVSVPGQE
jgi:hypothetical protein